MKIYEYFKKKWRKKLLFLIYILIFITLHYIVIDYILKKFRNNDNSLENYGNNGTKFLNNSFNDILINDKEYIVQFIKVENSTDKIEFFSHTKSEWVSSV